MKMWYYIKITIPIQKLPDIKQNKIEKRKAESYSDIEYRSAVVFRQHTVDAIALSAVSDEGVVLLSVYRTMPRLCFMVPA